MDLSEVAGWLNAGKGAVELLRASAALLPKGEKRAAIESRIRAAETSLQASNANLAKELGMKLCDCTFPPQIMLWQEGKKAHVCPRAECGRERLAGMKISASAVREMSPPRHPQSWMGR